MLRALGTLKRLLVKLANFIAQKLGDWLGDLETERGQHFPESMHIVIFPDGKMLNWSQIDDDNLPEGTLIAEYRFEHGQEIWRE